MPEFFRWHLRIARWLETEGGWLILALIAAAALVTAIVLGLAVSARAAEIKVIPPDYPGDVGIITVVGEIAYEERRGHDPARGRRGATWVGSAEINWK
jgi:hypothetical protein